MLEGNYYKYLFVLIGMKEIILDSNRIMTTNDFPVHNEQILKIYFRIAKENPGLLPSTPVIHKSVGLPLLKEENEFSIKHNKSIKDFFEKNPEVEYIMCDGSHKTTALNLTKNKIHAMLIEKDEDLKKFRDLENSGEIFSFASIENTIEELLDEKAGHFSEAEFFQTVQSKTDRMVDSKVIPEYMIDFYRK